MSATDETTLAGPDEHSPGSGSLRPHLIVMSGQRLGESIRVTSDNVVIGRDPEAALSLDEEGLSRHHAKVVLLPYGVCMIKDLGSKNGTSVNGQKVDACPLDHGDTICVGFSTIIRFSMEDALESKLREELVSQAMRDPLTGIQNKRSFEDEMARSLAFARRHREALSLILFDADHFKRVNDTHGHTVGDAVLCALAARIKHVIRTEDHFSRVGGEEFALILRGIDQPGAHIAAERMCRIVSASPLKVEGIEVSMTISLGCSTFLPGRHGESVALVKDADDALYRAKQGGRNQVASADDVAGTSL